MAKKRQLSKKKMDVIEDLFDSQFDEQLVLKKHRLSRAVYNKWLANESFIREFDRRIAWLNRHSQAIIAKYASLAAAKLVQLTDSESQETARKACLDIISLPKLAARKTEPQTKHPAKPVPPDSQLAPETAGRLLAALAEEKKGNSQ